MSVQLHEAKKAGRHFDLRLGEGHSWALRYWPERGQTRLAVRQPTHKPSYMSFQGPISEGYGAGMVTLVRYEQVEILKANERLIRFNTRGEKYVLKRVGAKNWILRRLSQ